MGIVENVAKNIEKFRGATKANKISIDALSKKAELPVATINNIRMGHTSDIKVSTLNALAKALGCTMDDLIK